MIFVFGYKFFDIDLIGLLFIWVWYLNEVKGVDVKLVFLGELNIEVVFVIEKWGFEKLEIISGVEVG